uniref:Uncharacterized protein n=1 Tax=Anguilla anguilla TaxID=7936 RepID=A0A0E9UTJ4_ANGAN
MILLYSRSSHDSGWDDEDGGRKF